jgi:hypothetical protein
VLKRLISTVVILPFLLSSIPAQANITDTISLPFAGTTFDSVRDGYGITYSDMVMGAQWNRVRSGNLPFSGELTIVVSQNVNIKNYTFKTELISPKGNPIVLSGSQFSTETMYSLSCYLTRCKTTTLKYKVDLPNGTELGEYTLQFTALWKDRKCSGTVCENNVEFSKTATAQKAMILKGTPEISNSDRNEIKVPGNSAQPEIKEPPVKQESVESNNFTKPQIKTIVCGKGKKTTRIAQYNPKCPTGWQQKTRTQCQKGDKKSYFWVLNSKCPKGYKRI